MPAACPARGDWTAPRFCAGWGGIVHVRLRDRLAMSIAKHEVIIQVSDNGPRKRNLALNDVKNV